jgi:hypothetical protein
LAATARLAGSRYQAAKGTTGKNPAAPVRFSNALLLPAQPLQKTCSPPPVHMCGCRVLHFSQHGAHPLLLPRAVAAAPAQAAGEVVTCRGGGWGGRTHTQLRKMLAAGHKAQTSLGATATVASKGADSLLEHSGDVRPQKNAPGAHTRCPPTGSAPVPSGSTATGGGCQCGFPAAACSSRSASRRDRIQATAGRKAQEGGVGGRQHVKPPFWLLVAVAQAQPATAHQAANSTYSPRVPRRGNRQRQAAPPLSSQIPPLSRQPAPPPTAAVAAHDQDACAGAGGRKQAQRCVGGLAGQFHHLCKRVGQAAVRKGST